MDKFDQQIAQLRPVKGPARLDEKQFMNKLIQARRAQLARRMLMGIMGLAALAIIAGALRRNIISVLLLTFRYFSDLPSMLTEYSHAYTATVSWPSIISVLCLLVLGVALFRSRKDLTAIHSKRVYNYASAVAVLALVLGITGLMSSPSQAHAEQDVVKRTLNSRGHMEVQVSGANYELYGKSTASDTSIRNQAAIEVIRSFNISKAYPKYQSMGHDGIVAEVKAVNTKDDCIYYVERRLEPTLDKVVNADSGCIRSGNTILYLNQQLQPIDAPAWKVGQAMYFTYAYAKTASGANGSSTSVVILLDGTADQYIASSNSEKVVPKGQPGTGVDNCGINLQDLCPQTGSIDVFKNVVPGATNGESGSAVTSNSLQFKHDNTMTEFFAKIVADDDQSLQLVTDSGQQLVIHWTQNVISEFNTNGAHNYHISDGALQILPGDHLIINVSYKNGMDLQNLSLSNVFSLALALKPAQPDPLSGQTYSKVEAMKQIQKY